MNYIFLAIAILLEVVGSIWLKLSDGFSRLLPTLGTVIAYVISFYFFALALKTISLGWAYAIWAGAGIVLTALVSILYFKESLDYPAVIGISLIIIGVVVLNVFSKSTLQ